MLKNILNKILENLLNNMLENILNKILNKKLENILEHMLEDILENILILKYINIMVRIIRNKIIFGIFYFILELVFPSYWVNVVSSVTDGWGLIPPRFVPTPCERLPLLA